MEAHGFLAHALIYLLAAVIAVPLFRRFRLGSILAYLVAGTVIGPSGLRLIEDPTDTLHFAEFGVVFLLFLLGLELSPQRLWVMRRIVFLEGGMQLLATTVAVAAVAWWFTADWRLSLIIGCALAQSSTAIAMQSLSERKEVASEHGRHVFGIALLQDAAAIPILASLALLASHQVAPAGAASSLSVWKAALVITALIVTGRAVLPPLFRVISKTGSVELFSATALLVVMGTAYLMQWVGLSLTLGAFLAGVLLANSEFRHEIESHIEPFKGLLLGLFFISVGMAIDVRLIERYPLAIGLGALALFSLKAGILYSIGRGLGKLEPPLALLLGALLGQGGEFGFVILAEANKLGILSAERYGTLLATIGLSMALTPLVLLLVSRWNQRVEQRGARPFDDIPDQYPRVIVAGFGRFGQIVSRVLSAQKIPHTVLETSGEQVDFSRRFGSTIYYGDPARPEILRAAHAERAEVFVLATDDPEGNVRIARVVRRLFPHLKLYARARNRQHVFKLMDLNVDYLIRDTFLSSLDMAREVLKGLGVPDALAAENVQRFRQHDEALLANQYLVHDDEAALVQSTYEARAELLTLFEADRKSGPGPNEATR